MGSWKGSKCLKEMSRKGQNVLYLNISLPSPKAIWLLVHLDGEIKNSFVNYTVHRCDRDTEIGRKSKCGGIALLSSPGLLCTLGEKYSNGSCELLITEFGELDITFVLIYRPPDSTLGEFKDVLTRVSTHLSSHPTKDTVVAGDFNFPTEIVEWRNSEEGYIPLPGNCCSDERKLQFQELLDLSNEYSFIKSLTSPHMAITRST